jgi:hypothetical protein
VTKLQQAETPEPQAQRLLQSPIQLPFVDELMVQEVEIVQVELLKTHNHHFKYNLKREFK